MFDIRCEGVADRRANRVVAFRCGFDDLIGSVVDHIGVVAGTADQRIGPGAAVELVVRRVTRDRVGKRVARSGECCAGENQVLDVVAQRPIHAGLHRVVAFASAFNNAVAGVVDDVGVVASAASHRVGTDATVEAVASGVASQHVGQFVAGRVDVRGSA